MHADFCDDIKLEAGSVHITWYTPKKKIIYPCITISSIAGYISINKEALELLKLPLETTNFMIGKEGTTLIFEPCKLKTNRTFNFKVNNTVLRLHNKLLVKKFKQDGFAFKKYIVYEDDARLKTAEYINNKEV